MGNISLYQTDGTIDPNDKVIGTDGTTGVDAGVTKNFSVSALKEFIAGSQLVTTKISVTSAQLLSLNGGGTHELIAAPGAGKIIIPVSFSAFLDFNTTAYASTTDANMKFRSGTTGTFGEISKTTIERGTDVYFTINPAGQEVEVNGNLNFTADNSFVLTTGDSPLTVNISYLIVDYGG